MFNCFLSLFVSVQVTDAHGNVLSTVVFFSLNFSFFDIFSSIKTSPCTRPYRAVTYKTETQMWMCPYVYTVLAWTVQMCTVLYCNDATLQSYRQTAISLGLSYCAVFLAIIL